MSHRKPPRQPSAELQAEKARLMKLKVADLKRQCIAAGIAKCYRKRKVDLVRELARSSVPSSQHYASPSSDDSLAQLTVKKLMVKCKDLGIKQCYKYRPKARLVLMLQEYLKPAPLLAAPGDQVVAIPTPFPSESKRQPSLAHPPSTSRKPSESKVVNVELQPVNEEKVVAIRKTLAVPLQLDQPVADFVNGNDFADEFIDVPPILQPGADFLPINIEALPQQKVDGSEVEADAALEGKYGDEWTLLGEGTFGRVYKAYDVEAKTTVVLKQMSKSEVNLDNLSSELHILQLLQEHCYPYFVCYVNAFQTATDWYIVMEFLGDYISLSQYIEELINGARPRDWVVTKQIVTNLLQAMEVLFTMHAINHRDIKPENVMVNIAHSHKGAIKVIDFGTSCHKQQCNSFDSQGSIAFLAPELAVHLLSVDDKKQSSNFTPASIHQSDLWSLGVTIWELVTGISFYQAFENVVTIQVIADFFKQFHAEMYDAYLESETPQLFELVYMTLISSSRLKDIMGKLWSSYVDKQMPGELYAMLRRIFLSLVEQKPSKRKLLQLY